MLKIDAEIFGESQVVIGTEFTSSDAETAYFKVHSALYADVLDLQTNKFKIKRSCETQIISQLLNFMFCSDYLSVACDENE